MMRPACTFILLLGMLSIVGCANYSWTSSLDAEDSRTIQFETAENRIFPHRPNFEYQLTERLKDEISTDGRLRLVDGGADLRLKVALTRFDEPNEIESLDTGEPAEILLRATAIVEVVGEGIVGDKRKRRVSVAVSYTPLLGDSREDGLTRLWRDLSREILDVAADTEWAN